MTKKNKEIEKINTTEGLATILKEDMDRLNKINGINDDFIAKMIAKDDMSAKEIETLDKVSITMLKRAALIGKMQQEIIDREEAKIRNKKLKEGSKLEIKLNI